MKLSFLRSLRGKLVIALAAAIILDVLVLSLGGAAANDVAPCDQSAGPTGCVDISLPAGLTADIYVGDTLVSPGLSSGRVSVKAYNYLHIVARNVKDGSPDVGDVYTYNSTGTWVYLWPGQIVSRTLTPTRTYLKGFLNVTCDANAQPGDSIACRPSVNGVVQPDIAPGQTATYHLTPGVYGVHVALVGDQANQWSPAAVDKSVTIMLSTTQAVTAAFSKANLVTLTLDEPGTYGDFYVNGQLIGTQVPTVQTWVPANQPATLEVRNVTDPAAFEFKWADNKTVVTMGSNQVQTVQLTLKKQWFIGWVDITCKIPDVKPEDDVVCTVVYDGQPKLIMHPGERAKFTADPGKHTVTMVLEGTSADKWQFAKVLTAQIVAGEVFTTVFEFKPLPPSAPRTTVLTGVGPEMHDVYLHGLALGNNPHSFSKIGDCETYSPLFLQPISNGNYSLGAYTNLADAITYYSPSGSFSHVGEAAINGLQLESILDPFWSDKNVCASDETPLDCEYRTHKPSVALIMVRTASYGNGPDSQFDTDLRKLVKDSLDHGVIPVLSTLAYQAGPHPSPEEMNATIRQVSSDMHVPLWDFWATTESLPNRGVDSTYHLTVPPNDYLSMYFTPTNLNYGMTRRNLEALQVLHEVLHKVILGY